jgi:hypothetical protein
MTRGAPALPFWLVTHREHVLNPTIKIPSKESFAAQAFTSADKLIGYIMAHQNGRLAINQVPDRAAVIVAVADLHKRGVSTLCIDRDPDGTGGTLISIADLIVAYQM